MDDASRVEQMEKDLYELRRQFWKLLSVLRCDAARVERQLADVSPVEITVLP